MKRFAGSFLPAGLALLVAGVCVLSSFPAHSQESAAAAAGGSTETGIEWTAADTQLANQYVRLLEARPEYSRVLDLLWQHYAAHDSVELLLGHYKAAAEASGATPQVRLVYAHLLRKNGDLPLARLRYQQVAKERSVRPHALLGLADVARERHDAQESARYLNELIEEDTAPADVLRRSLESLAELHIEQSNSASALAVWRRLIERFPEDLGMLQELAGRMIGAGYLDDAITVYNKLREDPDPEKRVAALVELGRLYEIADDFDGAAAALNDGRGATHFKHHTHLEFLSLLVRLYERQGRLEELEAIFVAEGSRERATEKALFTAARFYALTASPNQRQKWLRKLARAVPGNMEYRRELVEVLVSNDHYADAKKMLEDFLAGGIEETLALRLMRVKIELRLEGRDSAAALLRDFLVARALGDQDKGEVLRFAEDNYLDEFAEQLLREELGADSEEAAFRLANLHFSRGRIAEARAVLDRHVALAGDEPAARAAALFKAAGVLQNMGLNEAASDALAEAVALQPEDLKYLIRLAESLSDAGKIPDAIRYYEVAWELCKTSEDRLDVDQRIYSLLQLADLQGETGDPRGGEPYAVPDLSKRQKNEVLGFLKKYDLTDPDTVNQRADGGGWLYRFFSELRDEAIESDAPAIQMRAAWWAQRMGDDPTAYFLLQKFRKANPNHLRAERLLLEVALSSGDDMLALAQLDLLSRIDPERRMEYALRRAQVRLRRGEPENRSAALEDLAGIAKDEGTGPDVLANLARVYERLGEINRAKAIYRRAFDKSSLHEKRELLVELTRLQVEAGAIDEALDTITELIREEHDIVQRRKELVSQIGLAMRHQSLAKLETDYEALQRRHPLEPFYSEALALIYENGGKAREAFVAIKKAYYSARKRDAHLLERMRHLAAETADVGAAIYYQRQLVAVPDNRADAGEWHKLIRMLELNFQAGEADRIRLRLESKFAQDPDVLLELMRYYLDARQPSAARRVLGRMVRLRPWDVTALLSLGILEKEAGLSADAAKRFLQVIAHTQEAADQAAPTTAIERFPLRGFSPKARPEMTNPTLSLEQLVDVVDDLRLIDNGLRVQVARYFESGRPEFLAVPDPPEVQRLRAIEELGELAAAPREPARKAWENYWRAHPPQTAEEKFWVAWCGGDWPRAWQILETALGDAPSSEQELFRCLYGVRMGRMPRLIDWVSESSDISGARKRRIGWLLAAVCLFSVDPETRLPDDQLEAFVGSSIINREHTYALLKLLSSGGHVREALRIGEITNAHGRVIPGFFDADLAALSGAAGDTGKQRAFLEDAVDRLSPLTGQFQEVIASYYGLQETDDQRLAFVERVLSRFAEAPENPGAAFGRARFLALVGEKELATEACRELVSMHLEQPKRAGASPTGRFINEGSQWMSLFDYAHGARRLGFSELARGPFSGAIDQSDLVAPLLDESGGHFQQFQSYLFHQIAWEFEGIPHRERMARIREHESSFRGPDDRESFARTVAGEEFHREAAKIYRDLLYAHPLSNEYARAFLGACEKARDDEAAIEYIELLLDGQIEEPEGASRADRIRLHAGFLRMALNAERLKVMADAHRGMAPQSPPEELHYHRELAGLLAEAGQSEDAARVYAEMDDGKHRSVALLRDHARVLRELGREEAAIRLLERIELGQAAASDRPVIEDLAALYRAVDDAGKLRALASRALDHQDDKLIIAVAGELSAAGKESEAESLLTLALRRSKSDLSRLRLAIPAIEIALRSDSFDRVAPLLEIFFASDYAEAETREERRQFIEAIRGGADGAQAAPISAFLESAAAANSGSVFADVCRLDFALASDDASAPLRAIVDRIASVPSHFEELSIAAESCLEHGAAAEAGRIMTALRKERPRVFDHAELSLRVHGALGNEAAVAALYNRILRSAVTSYVPGTTVIELGEALSSIGEDRRAARLYEFFYDRISAPGTVNRDLVEHYARYLMDRGDVIAAGNVLRRAFSKSGEYDPALIVDLYEKGKGLDAIPSGLARFDLSSGTRKRVEFLARQRKAGQDTGKGAQSVDR